MERIVQGKSSSFGANCRKLLFFCLLWQGGHWCGKVYFVDLNLSEMGNEDRSILVPPYSFIREEKRAACVFAAALTFFHLVLLQLVPVPTPYLFLASMCEAFARYPSTVVAVLC